MTLPASASGCSATFITVFGDADVMSTEAILGKLHVLDESPSGDWHGKPLDARGLARLLKPYGVKPKVVRIGATTPRGCTREDLHDPWSRYGVAIASATSTTRPSQSQAQLGRARGRGHDRQRSVQTAADRIELAAGDGVRLMVTSDVTTNCTCTAAEIEAELRSGEPTTLEAKFDEPGLYYVEAHYGGPLLLQFGVR